MKSILMKELIKTNKIIIILVIIHLSLAVYHWLQIRGAFTVGVPITIWADVISRGSFFFSRFENTLLASAAAIGIFQFYYESSRKRFRISCHLPLNENIMIASMAFFGIISVTCLWLIDAVGVYITARIYFPYEIYSQVVLIMFYWYAKAVVIYVLASSLTLEPSWAKKGVLAVLLYAYSRLISVSTYNPETTYICLAAVFAIVFIPVIYYPALRFRKGA